MFKIIKITLLIAITLIIVSSCNKPKVIMPTSGKESTSKSSGIFSDDSSTEVNANTNTVFSDDLHTVVVNEVLPTEKYAYLHVNEGEEQFWIATRSKNVKVGETYYYKGGLLKTNFESKEYNRVFKKVYLISNLVEARHGNNSNKVNTNEYTIKKQNTIKENIPTHTNKIIEHKGSIKIAELIKNLKKYEGKTVQLSGICTKINSGIMNRNWIHLKDGSNDDYDLVITSDVFVPEGSAITIKALVTLNKDFGAGYKYDLILENGTLIK